MQAYQLNEGARDVHNTRYPSGTKLGGHLIGRRRSFQHEREHYAILRNGSANRKTISELDVTNWASEASIVGSEPL